jgi:hypothetical protein
VALIDRVLNVPRESPSLSLHPGVAPPLASGTARRLWAEIDEDWKRKEECALAQRATNAVALREGGPVPYPNPFAALNPIAERNGDDSPEATSRAFSASWRMRASSLR